MWMDSIAQELVGCCDALTDKPGVSSDGLRFVKLGYMLWHAAVGSMSKLVAWLDSMAHEWWDAAMHSRTTPG
jgi:hypothetical protein